MNKQIQAVIKLQFKVWQHAETEQKQKIYAQMVCPHNFLQEFFWKTMSS